VSKLAGFHISLAAFKNSLTNQNMYHTSPFASRVSYCSNVLLSLVFHGGGSSSSRHWIATSATLSTHRQEEKSKEDLQAFT
jgi:hypothetical protein